MFFTNTFTTNIYFTDTLMEEHSLHFLTFLYRFENIDLSERVETFVHPNANYFSFFVLINVIHVDFFHASLHIKHIAYSFLEKHEANIIKNVCNIKLTAMCALLVFNKHTTTHAERSKLRAAPFFSFWFLVKISINKSTEMLLNCTISLELS